MKPWSLGDSLISPAVRQVFLYQLVAARQRNDALLFKGVSYRAYSALFKVAAVELRLPAVTLHMLRHGAASEDFYRGVRDLRAIQMRGRWRSFSGVQRDQKSGRLLSFLSKRGRAPTRCGHGLGVLVSRLRPGPEIQEVPGSGYARMRAAPEAAHIALVPPPPALLGFRNRSRGICRSALPSARIKDVAPLPRGARLVVRCTEMVTAMYGVVMFSCLARELLCRRAAVMVIPDIAWSLAREASRLIPGLVMRATNVALGSRPARL